MSRIPQEAVAACGLTFDAVNEKVQCGTLKRYDATGIFSMTCWHGQVLFLVNIYTPGEQQCYIIAALEELLSMLLPHATVLQAYDIECVVDHSLDLFPILEPSQRNRVAFIINHMHAFRHGWHCQIVYCPRFRVGATLADHEDVERNWSRLRKLVPITRDAPINSVEKAITDVKQVISTSGALPASLELLCGLQDTHARLSREADNLYASLNIREAFPELANLDLPKDFLHTLLIACNLKGAVRKRAIASFQEWEELDRAVAGKKEPLGTKLYQATQRAISKRQPALHKLIDKYNALCAKLDTSCPVGCQIPLPSPLPTKLSELRNNPSLHENVWISPQQEVPQWLNDEDVRDGMQSLHLIDRCREEATRLNLERANLRSWLEEELAVINKAIVGHSQPSIALSLEERRTYLQHLCHRWAPQIQDQLLPYGLPPSRRPAHAPETACMRSAEAPHARPQANDCPAQASETLHCQATRTLPLPATMQAHDQFEVGSDMDIDSDSDVDRSFTDRAPDPCRVSEEGDVDPSAISDPEDAADLLGDEEEVEETTTLDDASIEIKWEAQPPRNLDCSLLHDLHKPNASRHRITGEFSHFAICGTLAGRLNGSGINAVAASLHTIFSGPTHDLPRARYKGADDMLQQFIAPKWYWAKPLWLLPIHRPVQQHWVFAAVDVTGQHIFFFDSLASRSGWRQDLRDVMALVTRMVALANRHGHPLHISMQEDPWSAYPMFEPGRAVQMNGYNCGLWVLCTLVAVIRGFDGAEIYETDIRAVRGLLADHIYTLPIT
ncbi:hypothetical protein MVEN_00658300 [Mycena venus]|uniref:Ubiquitin-like protease family profile domain-containing protein n=1 Tax=Mycena venus TaxID=2733690 RepID=A0A8H6YQP8_9AGAR|nr:hypothetical protein MVEN_00658300 [Mycena venus]